MQTHACTAYLARLEMTRTGEGGSYSPLLGEHHLSPLRFLALKPAVAQITCVVPLVLWAVSSFRAWGSMPKATKLAFVLQQMHHAAVLLSVQVLSHRTRRLR